MAINPVASLKKLTNEILKERQKTSGTSSLRFNKAKEIALTSIRDQYISLAKAALSDRKNTNASQFLGLASEANSLALGFAQRDDKKSEQLAAEKIAIEQLGQDLEAENIDNIECRGSLYKQFPNLPNRTPQEKDIANIQIHFKAHLQQAILEDACLDKPCRESYNKLGDFFMQNGAKNEAIEAYRTGIQLEINDIRRTIVHLNRELYSDPEIVRRAFNPRTGQNNPMAEFHKKHIDPLKQKIEVLKKESRDLELNLPDVRPPPRMVRGN